MNQDPSSEEQLAAQSEEWQSAFEGRHARTMNLNIEMRRLMTENAELKKTIAAMNGEPVQE